MAGGPGIPIPGTNNLLQLSVGMCGESPCIAVTVNWLQVFIDIIEGLISLFSGRPKDEATQQSAATAMGSRNPAARLYGLQLLRMLTEWGIHTSSSDPGEQKILGAAHRQAVENFVAQGFAAAEARDAIDWILSRAGQAGETRPSILNKPGCATLQVWGPTKVIEAQRKAIAHADIHKLAGKHRADYIERATWQHAPLGQLFHVYLTCDNELPPAKCPPGYQWSYFDNGCTPIPHHRECPEGWHYDARTETCRPGEPPPPPPSPCPAGWEWNEPFLKCTPKPQKGSCPSGYYYNPQTGTCDPVSPGPNPDDECCAQTVAALETISQTIASLEQAIQQGFDASCCTNLVQSIGSVATALNGILDQVTQIATAGPSPALDLTPVTDALTALGDCLCKLPGAVGDQTDVLDTRLGEVVEALNTGNPALKRIADALDVDSTLGDELIRDAESKGIFPSDLGQLIISAVETPKT